MSALFTFNGYDNEVIANKLQNSLITKLDLSRFVTPDYELTENPGMVKKIHRYSLKDGSGVDVLGRGEGSSSEVSAQMVEEAYKVVRTQGRTRYYTDDALNDPFLVNSQLELLSQAMVNDFTRAAVREWSKSTNQYDNGGTLSASMFAQAISKYTSIYESQEGLFFLANIEMEPTIRGILGAELKFVEPYITRGSIGLIYNVPVYLSKAVPKGIIFLATKEAVTLFTKRALEVEQTYDPNDKLHVVYATVWNICALTDESRCVVIGDAMDTTATITAPAADDVKVEGAAQTGSTVSLYINGEYAGRATAAGSEYEIECSALKVGDSIHIVVEKEGYLNSFVDATVSA